MKRLKLVVLGLLFLCIFLSCQNSNDKQESYVSDKEKAYTKTIENRNNQKVNRLFLDFWLEMNEEEFNFIKDSLINENVLTRTDSTIEFAITVKNPFYIAGSSEVFENTTVIFNTKPSFNNNKLNEINLKFIKLKNIDSNNKKEMFGCNYNIIELFKSKYGKPIVDSTSDKLHYSYKWFNDNRTIEIIEDFKMKYDEISRKQYISLENFIIKYYSLEKYLEKVEQIKETKAKTKNDNEKELSKTFDNI